MDELKTNELETLRQLSHGSSKKPAPMPRQLTNPAYDFEHLAETLSDALLRQAEETMSEAHRVADAFRQFAAVIRGETVECSKSLADINARLRASGEQVLEASKRFNGG